MGGGWGWGYKGEGIEEYRLVVTKSHGDVKHSIGNVVNSIVRTVRGASWALEI